MLAIVRDPFQIQVTEFEPNPDTIPAEGGLQASVLSSASLSGHDRPGLASAFRPDRPQGKKRNGYCEVLFFE